MPKKLICMFYLVFTLVFGKHWVNYAILWNNNKKKLLLCVLRNTFAPMALVRLCGWFSIHLVQHEYRNLLPLKLLTFLRKLNSLTSSIQLEQQPKLLSWQPNDRSLSWGRGNKRKKTQKREKTNRIEQRERGIMGGGNEGTINTHTHTATIGISRIPLSTQ